MLLGSRPRNQHTDVRDQIFEHTAQVDIRKSYLTPEDVLTVQHPYETSITQASDMIKNYIPLRWPYEDK
jgi:hypothetical protein